MSDHLRASASPERQSAEKEMTRNHDEDKDGSRKRQIPIEEGSEDAGEVDHKKPRKEDQQQRKRGQRMFGVLLGTLSKFKETATKQKTEAEIRREQLEQRLQQKIQKENEEIAEKVSRENEIKRQRMKAQREEEVRQRAEFTNNVVKAQQANLSRYIPTTTKPTIYFAPAKHNEASQALLDQVWKDYLSKTEDSGAVSADFGLNSGSENRDEVDGRQDVEMALGADDEVEESVVGEVF
ncbi:hypothetical protein HDU67_002758 [Dinochytrium kinnereticum]|nr:hypothetical protein HDU67_002758 [Dinochytrium kinnereticum]